MNKFEEIIFMNMKVLYLLFFFFFSQLLFGQDIEKKLEKIFDLKQANAFLDSNKSVNGFVY